MSTEQQATERPVGTDAATDEADGSGRRRRIEQLVGPGLLAAVAVAGAVALVWPEDSLDFRPAQALVIATTPCDAEDAHDRVRFDLDGETVRADLNGCGNRVGAVLPVEVPDTQERATLMVKLEGTTLSGENQQEDRLGGVLFVGAGLGGALLGWQLRGRVGRHP